MQEQAITTLINDFMSELLLTLTSLKHCLPSGYLEPMAA